MIPFTPLEGEKTHCIWLYAIYIIFHLHRGGSHKVTYFYTRWLLHIIYWLYYILFLKREKKGKYTHLHNEVDIDMNMNTILDNMVIFEKLECKIVKIPQLSGLYFFFLNYLFIVKIP